MAEPTQELHAENWMRERRSIEDRPLLMIERDMVIHAAAYANHRTAELQAKVHEAHKFMVDHKQREEELQARIATLEAELAARDFVPITDEHRDGEYWQVAIPSSFGFYRKIGYWNDHTKRWRADGDNIDPTHAAPLPKPPAKEGE